VLRGRGDGGVRGGGEVGDGVEGDGVFTNEGGEIFVTVSDIKLYIFY